MKKIISLFMVLVLLIGNVAFAFEETAPLYETIMPLNTHFASDWEELRDAVTAITNGTGTGEIRLTDNILGGGSAIEISAGVNITVTGDNGTYELVQTAVGQRHFSVVGLGSTLILKNITLTGDTLPGNVGGIHIDGGSLFLEDGSAITQVAAAAVEVTNGGSLVMQDGSQISNNGNFSGGTINGIGVHISGGSTFTMNGGAISGNQHPLGVAGTSNGGGVFVGGSTGTTTVFTMNGGVIYDNAVTGSGGGAHVASNARFYMQGGVIESNTAVNGGGVAIAGGNAANPSGFIMAGATDTRIIDGNTAQNGAGVHVSAGVSGLTTVFEMGEGSYIRNNTTPATGNVTGIGVRISQGTFTMDGGSIEDNFRPLGAEGNTNGGGVSLNSANARFDMNGGTISGHTVSQSGGGVHVLGGSIFTMNGGEISSNVANGNAAHQGGGGVFVSGTNTRFFMRSGVVSDNTASGINVNSGGGGVFVTGGTAAGPARFVMEDYPEGAMGERIIENNTALHGAGIHMTADPSAVGVAGGQFPRVYVNGNTYIRNNQAPASADEATGFGVRLSGGTLTLNSGNIADNYRTAGVSNGGGVFLISNNARFVMNGGTISGHAVSDSGGGAYIAPSAEFTMNGGTITNNTALSASPTQGGGGVFVAPGAGANVLAATGPAGRTVFTMNNDAAIANNSALHGAGVHLTGNQVHATNGRNAVFLMNDGVITDNTTPANHNSLLATGIGVRVSGGTFTMVNGAISGNHRTGVAESQGGGIFMTNNTTDNTAGLAISGGTISGNTATDGGGLFYENTNVLTNIAIAPPVVFTDNMAISGAFANNNLAENNPQINPGTRSVEWFDNVPNHAFTNYDINATGIQLWSVEYQVDTLAGSVGAEIVTTGGNEILPTGIFVRDGASVIFTATPAAQHNFYEWHTRTRSQEIINAQREAEPFGSRISEDELPMLLTITAHTRVRGNFEAVIISLPGEIIVTVVDEEGNPIYGAEVRIYNSEGKLVAIATTTSDGKLTVSMQEGNYTAKVTHPNFEDAEKEVAIEAGKTTNETIVMQKPYVPLPPPTDTGTGSWSLPGGSPPLPPETTPVTVISPEHQAFIIGFDDGTVRPHVPTTRAQAATIFFRLMPDEIRTNYWRQDNSFSDVNLNDWFNNAVSTTTNAGVFTGFPDGTFQPNREITRAEFVAAVVRFMGENPSTAALFFSDVAGHWAQGYINTAAQMGWVTGDAGLNSEFRPNDVITRAETAALINRMLSRLPETEDDLLPGMIVWADNTNTQAWYYLYIQEASNSHRYVRKANGIHESWVELIPNRPWYRLERSDSQPEDIFK